MDLYAPKYFSSFVCIADKCQHSCCVGWEIDVDCEALKKYRSSKKDYAKKILDSIEDCDTPHFALGESERCPHLCENGLCRIILEMGEDYLCNICREHPRFYNYTANRKEVGLGLVCEEACRIILSSDEYADITKIGEIDEDCDFDEEIDTLPERAAIYGILSNRVLPYDDRLEAIYERYSVSPRDVSDERWRDLLSSLEYLSADDKKLLSSYSFCEKTPCELERYLERALAYFIFRHVSAAFDECDLRASLGLALFLERLLCSAIVGAGDFSGAAIFDTARRLSEELEYSEENTEEIKFEFSFI